MQILRTDPSGFSEIVALFQRNDFALRKREWFDWKHTRNPGGASQVFEARSAGRLIGTVALVPQSYRFREAHPLGLQAVDGLLDGGVRGKGLFTQLMSFVLRVGPDVRDREHFHAGFASLPASMRALEHAGWHRLAEFRVLKALLHPRLIPPRHGGRLIRGLLTLVWPLVRAVYFASAGGVAVRRVERFVEDMNRFQPRDRVCGDRSAQFLNWRVIDNPKDEMRAYTFHQRGQIIGYSVCKLHAGESAWDIVELRTGDTGPSCAAALLRHLYHVEHAAAADFWMLGGFLQKDKLPRLLLNRGASGAMFVHGVEKIGLPSDSRHWAASYLDSDW